MESSEFNNLTIDEKRVFIIDKVINDVYFKDFHDEFRKKFNVENDFIKHYKSTFDSYKDAIKQLYVNHTRYKDLYDDIYSSRRDIDLLTQEPEIMLKDLKNLTFVDNFINLYNHIHNKYYELDLDKLGLERSLCRLFKNKNMDRNLRIKYQIYEQKTLKKTYSDDEDFEYELKLCTSEN